MDITITAKVKIMPSKNDEKRLIETFRHYRNACNYISGIIFNENSISVKKLHPLTYNYVRITYGLKAQMAQSALRTVISKYKTNKTNGHKWTHVQFKKPQHDLVYGRDYSLIKGVFSVNTISGKRAKVPFEIKGMEQYFDGSWSFGTAKLIFKHGKWFLHIPMSKELEDVNVVNSTQVVGIDMGINFIATTYDSNKKTLFFNGRKIKHKRAKYKQLRKELQQKGTPSARRKLKAIGQRENRWMSDVNHQVSKALVEKYSKDTLFVIEDLTGIRSATEKVHINNRYETVSWAFFDLRKKLEYKAQLNGLIVIAVDPMYTSQTCPKCGHIEKSNRNKKLHHFKCKKCTYQSNDDRIGAMNLWQNGIKYIAKVTV